MGGARRSSRASCWEGWATRCARGTGLSPTARACGSPHRAACSSGRSAGAAQVRFLCSHNHPRLPRLTHPPRRGQDRGRWRRLRAPDSLRESARLADGDSFVKYRGSALQNAVPCSPHGPLRRDDAGAPGGGGCRRGAVGPEPRGAVQLHLRAERHRPGRHGRADCRGASPPPPTPLSNPKTRNPKPETRNLCLKTRVGRARRVPSPPPAAHSTRPPTVGRALRRRPERMVLLRCLSLPRPLL